MNLGNLRALRMDRGVLQKQMADALGVESAALNSIEIGRSPLTAAVAEKTVIFFAQHLDTRRMAMLKFAIDTTLAAQKCSIPPPAMIAMPAAVFIEAVRLAREVSTPDAIKLITSWWDKEAPESLRGAFSFMFYVDCGEDGWWSGCAEEGRVDRNNMRANGFSAATLDDIVIEFYREPVTVESWFGATRMDDTFGHEGGVSYPVSGAGVALKDSENALYAFPFRFPELWAKLAECSRAQRPASAMTGDGKLTG